MLFKLSHQLNRPTSYQLQVFVTVQYNNIQLLPLRNQQLVAVVWVDHVHLDSGRIPNTVAGIPLKEVESLRAVGVSAGGVADTQVLAAADDAILVGLVRQDSRKGDVINEVSGIAAAPAGSVVEADLLDVADEDKGQTGVGARAVDFGCNLCHFGKWQMGLEKNE